MLVSGDITLLWLMEFYTHKGQKLDGNCFYRAIALWRDETSDRKHGEIRSLCNSLIEKYPQVFQPLLFASRSVDEHVKKSKLAGSWAETVDIFSCATLLKRTISTFST